MAADHCVYDDDYANQGQGNESEANLRAGKVLRRDRADLRANGRASVHNQGDQNIDVAFHRVAKGAVAGGNDDFEKIGSNCEMRGDSKYVNHGRHPNVAGAAAEKAAE